MRILSREETYVYFKLGCYRHKFRRHVDKQDLNRGVKLVVMKCLQSPYYLAALGKAIGRAIDKGMQDRLMARIDHKKAERGLTYPASQKDVSIADIMGLLHLEGPTAETSVAKQLQLSPEQLMLPIHRLEDQVRLSISKAMIPSIESLSAGNLVGEASTFVVPTTATTTALSTTFVQASSVPLISMENYEVSGAESSIEVPPSPKIVFEKEELDTKPEHTTAP
nr:hypothetical protein [Tanacetum cinerariifolium]